METEIWIILIYLLVGGLAGLVGGTLGLGGGIVIVPALFFIFTSHEFNADILMHMAIATSLATIVLTSISSTLAHHKRGAVLWPQVFLLVPGIILGGFIGGFIADFLNTDTLRVVFGLFEIGVAGQILFDIHTEKHRQLPARPGMLAAGAGIGCVSTLLGIGGGTITVPFLLWCNVNIRNAVATSAACGFPIALAGGLAMVIAGWNAPGLPTGATGYIYWPAALAIMLTSVAFAPLGAQIAHTIPVNTLKKVFALVLVIVGIKILLG